MDGKADRLNATKVLSHPDILEDLELQSSECFLPFAVGQGNVGPKYSQEFLTAALSELLHRISRVRLNIQQGRLLSSLEMAAQLTS